jgi:hypothetical protein
MMSITGEIARTSPRDLLIISRTFSSDFIKARRDQQLTENYQRKATSFRTYLIKSPTLSDCSLNLVWKDAHPN